MDPYCFNCLDPDAVIASGAPLLIACAVVIAMWLVGFNRD